MSEHPQIITFLIPADEKQQLEELAARDERTVSAVLRLLVRRYLTEQEEMNAA